MLASSKRFGPLARANVTALLSMALSVCIAAHSRAVPIFNSSFERPQVPAGSSTFDNPSAADQGAGPGDSPWLFTGASGVAVAGGRFGGYTLPPTSDGTQAGYVDISGAISQQITFPAAGQYTLTYQEAGIGIYAVLVDGVTLVGSHASPADFAPVTANFSIATAGPHTLTFQDTDPREIPSPVPAFVDAVVITPEPVSLTVFLSVAAASHLWRPGRRTWRARRPHDRFFSSRRRRAQFFKSTCGI
jgi:hypothetical protein